MLTLAQSTSKVHNTISVALFQSNYIPDKKFVPDEMSDDPSSYYN